MSDLYTIAAIGLQDGQHRLEAISHNAASASVPGFKRRVAAQRSFASDLARGEPATSASAAPIRVDLRAGPIAPTGRALDVAIESSDLFFALSDGTQTWLSRAGAFHIDANGLLVGERGLRVQGTGGDIRLDSANVDIRPDGQIMRDGVAVAALQLFAPAERAKLAPAGGALLTAAEGALPAETGSVRLRSGALEGSNAGSGTEMVDLLALSRQFESLIRVTQGYDELLGRTIQKLGEV
jgi:flagellar basal body rod protein FlgG